MAPRAIPASFWRGGTSRGLVFRASVLSSYTAAQTNAIILTALGSPDSAGRQISGLGGGVSSLSKVSIIGSPGEGRDKPHFKELPGVAWADEEGKSWDIVYRFAQVSVRTPELDWSSTCGNMLAAVATSGVQTILPYSTLFERSRTLPTPAPGQPLLFPLSILSASTGDIFKATVPIDPITLEMWEPPVGQGCVIAGVPGEAAGIMLEMPLAEGGGLLTPNATEIVHFENMKIPISILSTGLPNIFLTISSLSLPPSLLSSSLSTLSSHPTLPNLLERLRCHIATQFNIPLSLSSPKIILISDMPDEGYETSTGTTVAKSAADLLVRATSSGDFHATIPGTTLGALNLGFGIPGTTIHTLIRGGASSVGGVEDGGEVVTIRAGHAAGVTESSVRFVGGKPESVVMMRTAREIMRGSVLVPESIFA